MECRYYKQGEGVCDWSSADAAFPTTFDVLIGDREANKRTFRIGLLSVRHGGEQPAGLEPEAGRLAPEPVGAGGRGLYRRVGCFYIEQPECEGPV